MKVTLPFLLVTILALAVPAGAVDFSAEAGSNKQVDKDRSMALRHSIEKRLSTTVASTHNDSASRNQSHQNNLSTAANSSINISVLSLIPDPGLKYLQLSDLGLAAEYEDGFVNSTAAQFYNSSFAAGAPAAKVGDGAAIIDYIKSVANTGLEIAQAEMYLIDRAATLSGKKTSKSLDKEGLVLNAAAVLGVDDLPPLAAQAWLDAEKGVRSRQLVRLRERIDADLKQVCRLNGTNSIACGSTVLNVTMPPRLTTGGVEIFGATTFAGLSANIVVSRTTSLQAAFDSSRNTSDSMRSEIADLDSEGRSFEAAMNRKEALNRSKGSKKNMGIGKYIPGLSN